MHRACPCSRCVVMSCVCVGVLLHSLPTASLFQDLSLRPLFPQRLYLPSQDSSSVGLRSVFLSPCLATNTFFDVSLAESHSNPPHVLFDALHSNLASGNLAAMLHQCSVGKLTSPSSCWTCSLRPSLDQNVSCHIFIRWLIQCSHELHCFHCRVALCGLITLS